MTAVAIYGGSFDPPHRAHVAVAELALGSGLFEALVVVPVYRHVFDKVLAPYEHRLALCRLAFGALPRVEVSDIERTLGTPNYTLHMLRALARCHPDWEMRLVIGADVLRDAPQWHAFAEVTALAPPWVVGRRGVAQPGAPEALVPGYSSTEIRAALRAHPRDDAVLAEALPPAVLAYIREQGLYVAGS